MATRIWAGHPLQEFVLALRRLRARGGDPTLRSMAARVHYSASTLCRTGKGEAVPSLGATLAYVKACNGDVELWRDQHRQLLAALQERERVTFFPWRGFVPGQDDKPSVQAAAIEAYTLARDGVESLAEAMRRLRAESGLTLTQIAERTRHPEIAAQIGGRGVPVSTLSDLCNPYLGRVPSQRTMHGFLLALDAPATVLWTWEQTRQILLVKPGPDPQLRRAFNENFRTWADRIGASSGIQNSGGMPLDASLEKFFKRAERTGATRIAFVPLPQAPSEAAQR
jgi:hypothetical protein